MTEPASSSPEVFGCTICRKTFTDQKTQLQHIRNAHSEKTIPCSHCNKKFASENALQQHLRGVNKAAEAQNATSSPSGAEPSRNNIKGRPQYAPKSDVAEPEPVHPAAPVLGQGGKRRQPRPSRNLDQTSNVDLRASSSSSVDEAANGDNSASSYRPQILVQAQGTPSKNIAIRQRKPVTPSSTQPGENRSIHPRQENRPLKSRPQDSPSGARQTPQHHSESPAFAGPRGGQHQEEQYSTDHRTPAKPRGLPRDIEANRAASTSKVAYSIARNIAFGSATPVQRNALSRAETPLTDGRGTPSQRKPVYPEYWPEEKARAAVKAGTAWEGVLRANPNASRMCFFTIPGRTKDLMVKDEWLNRAFPGDTVIIQMLDAEDLKAEELFQERRKEMKRGDRKDNKKKNPEKTPKEAEGAESSAPQSNASSARTPGATPAKEPSDAQLRSEILKGLNLDAEDSDSDLETSSESDADSNNHADSPSISKDLASEFLIATPSLPGTIQSTSITVETIKDDDIEIVRQEMQVLNLTTHAKFDARLFEGILEEGKPKSDLAKVICITRAYHEDIGFVGRLERVGSHGWELRPVAIQYPVFDVPAPDAQFIAEIPEPVGRDATAKQKKAARAGNKLLFLCRFARWGTRSRRPLGTRPEFVGDSGNVEAECRAITSTHMIDTEPFDKSLSEPFGTDTNIVITPGDLANRRDLRKTCIFTVDPPTARDIDDALSIEKISDDRYQVGVHIADVSHYVTPNSPLDKLAQERSTSVYMVNTMYPMLPTVLSTNLCSLNPKVDRFAFSVLWELDGQGNIVDGTTWIGRTIIRSCVKLSYLDAQKCIDAQEAGDLSPALAHLAQLSPEHPTEKIAQDILHLNTLAQIMRARRFSTGALRLSRLRLHFELDEAGMPIDAHPYYIKESNQLIEEFMLLANMSVAQFIYKAFPESALLRSHPEPKDDILLAFSHLMKALNIEFDTTTSGGVFKSLTQLEDWQHRPIEELVTKAMNAAIYLSTGTIKTEQDLWHYALNVPYYTHFTSPIRRYPDIVVHRQIQAAIDKAKGIAPTLESSNPLADPCHDREWVATVADHSNERKKASRKAQDDSIKLFACLYLKRKPYVDVESIILDVSKTKLSVFSPQLCLKAKIEFADKKGYEIKFDAGKRILSVIDKETNNVVLALTYFSKVSVTYFTRGSLPMDVGADLSLWWKPEPKPEPKSDEGRPESRASAGKQNGANRTEAKKQEPKKAGTGTPAKPSPKRSASAAPSSSSTDPSMVAQDGPDDTQSSTNQRKPRRERKPRAARPQSATPSGKAATSSGFPSDLAPRD